MFVNTDYWFFDRPQLMTDIKDANGNVITSIPYKMPTVGNSQSGDAYVSWFGRLIYSYKDKYLLTATLRRDASSKFGKNNRWGTFPAINFGWRITEEDFMKNLDEISNLKFRAGYGVSGSANVPNYQFQSRADGGSDYNYVFNEGRVEGYTLTRLANPNLQWEEIEMANMGLDAGFYNNRLNVTLDVYKKNTKKLFLGFAPPLEVGAESTPNGNLGEVQNIGLELDINGVVIDRGDFNWNASLNFSTTKNKVVALAADGADRFNAQNITRVGEEIGALYGYVGDGIFQNWEEVYSYAYQNQATTGEFDSNGNPIYDKTKVDLLTTTSFTSPGDFRFKDLNGDGIIDGDNDRAIIGSTIPDLIWGFNNDFSYKGLSLSLFFQGVHGVDVYNRFKRDLEENLSQWFNRPRTILNAWDGEGSSNSQQRITVTNPNDNFRNSSNYVEDASFIRLKNVKLAYTIPTSLTSKAGINNVQLYISGSNLFTVTKYSGYDPEVGLRNGGNPETAGVDFGAYPITKQYVFGLKVTF